MRTQLSYEVVSGPKLSTEIIGIKERKEDSKGSPNSGPAPGKESKVHKRSGQPYNERNEEE